jgi:hypothetical protein
MENKNNRREFLKNTGLAGIGLVGASVISAYVPVEKGKEKSSSEKVAKKQHSQKFNMCGYAAPKIDTVKIGFIGLGNRGPGHVSTMSLLEGVEVKALCDMVLENVEKVRKSIEYAGFNPKLYSRDKEAWKKLCDQPDIDLVYICTPWNLHTEMAVYAME